LLGNGAYSLSQWLRVAVLVKLADPSLVGEYALALALINPVFMFANLQLRAVQATDARNRYEFSDFATLRLICSAGALLGIAAVTLTLRWSHSMQALVLLLVMGSAVDSFSDIYGGLQQKHERLDRLGISLVLRAVLSITAFAVVFRESHSILLAAATLPVASAIVLLTWDAAMGKRILHRAPLLAWDSGRLRHLALFSLPLGISMMLISLNVNIPRYVLIRYSGSAELGIFASLSYVVMALGLIVNGLGQSVSARLSRFYAQGEVQRFRALILRFCEIGALLGVLGLGAAIFIGRPALALIYRPEYSAYVNVLRVLALAAGVSAVASFLGYGITAAHVFRYQIGTMLAALFTTVVASLILVPIWNAMGAAVALLISSFVQVLLAGAILRRALRKREQLTVG
jgi:O-antigen/teichoic acid export membrane protein